MKKLFPIHISAMIICLGFIFFLNMIGSAEAQLDRLQQYQLQVREMPQSPTAHLQLALAYDENRMYDEAINEYQQVLDLDSNQVIAHTNLAALYIKKRRYERALRHYERAIELDSNNAAAYSGIGFLYYRSNMYPQAIENYQKALALLPNDAETSYNLALTYDGQKEWNAAIKYYRQTLAIDPNYADAHYNLAAIYKAQGNNLQARLELEEMIQISPGDVSSRLLLAELYEAQANLEKALEQYQIASEITPMDFDLMMKVGYLAETLQNPALAEETYLRIVDHEPEHVDANVALARIYAKEGYYSDARTIIEEVESRGTLVEGSGQIHIQEAIESINKNDYDSAEKSLRKAISSEPQSVKAYVMMGQVKLQQQEYNEAKEFFQKTVDLDPKNVDAHYLLGYLYDKENNASKAESEYKTVLELDKNSTKAHYNLGVIYVRKGNDAYKKSEESTTELERTRYLLEGHEWYDRAITHLEKAVVFDPTNVNAHFSLAKIYQVRGMEAAAFDEYRQVVKYDPTNLAASSRAGLYYAQQKDFAKAHEYFDRALSLGTPTADIYADYAEALYLEGSYAQALNNVELAMRRDPLDARIRMIAGDIYVARGQPEMALREYENGVRLDKSNKEYRFKYARTLEDLKRFREATAQYDTTLIYDPGNIEAKQRIAYLRQLKTRKDEENRLLAKREYREILDRAPYNLAALINLGAMAAQDDSIDLAQGYLERATYAHPNSYVAHFNLALILDIQGRKTRAKDQYKRCLDINPAHANAHYYLGLLYEENNELSKAASHFEEAVRLDSTNSGARIRLTALRSGGY